jgi:hypothetical protein
VGEHDRHAAGWLASRAIQDEGIVLGSHPAGESTHVAIVKLFEIMKSLMVRRDRKSGAAAALVLFAACVIALVSAAASSAARRPKAHAARSLNGMATAHLHLVRANGSQLDEEGPVTGALPGSMRAVLNTGSVFVGHFTIHTHGGSIEGRGEATRHGSGRYQSFSGSITLTGGSGRYSHAHGRAGLYGTFDRRTYAMVIQTTGRLSY